MVVREALGFSLIVVESRFANANQYQNESKVSQPSSYEKKPDQANTFIDNLSSKRKSDTCSHNDTYWHSGLAWEGRGEAAIW